MSADTLRKAAKLMRERAGEMRVEMDRRPATWEHGYRAETAASLGGPAGELAGPWGPDATEAVAEWLETEAVMAEKRGNSTEGQTFHALKVARAYLGETS
jgi:hypothetical protein